MQLPVARAGPESRFRTGPMVENKPPQGLFWTTAPENRPKNFCYSANRETVPALR
ncbi:hypothetical protein [Streptomyces sp. H27-H5]|uniref:hypothetical protein n=1 Tax=Streptomyces sp. H27-H5 TaxID=2996460 RepID=UPI00226EA0B5|nr:hypothetical protein [Streptomyces sp. H27-H5]MCY0955799.1 hypothetical protein [Streptomyces sp. H27-H5]